MSLLPKIKSPRNGSVLGLAGINTLCSVVFQLGILQKLGVGARSDLYYAAILVPLVLYSVFLGPLNSILIPMFVEASEERGKAQGLFWNTLIVIVVGGALILSISYLPTVWLFRILFKKLIWIDMRQVADIVLIYSAYQVVFAALSAKNCYLFARGRALSAQLGIFAGWVVSGLLLWRAGPIGNLSQIPSYLLIGTAFALAIPNLGKDILQWHRRYLNPHVSSLLSRSLLLTVGSSISKVEPLFDGIVASFCSQGDVTIYFFFSRVLLYLTTVVYSGYVQPATKQLAESATERQWDALRRGTHAVTAYSIALSLLMLALCGFALFGISRLAPLSLRGYAKMFHATAVLYLMTGYLVGLLACATYANSLIILRSEKVYVLASSLIIFPGIAFKIAGAHWFGLRGLALGSSLYWIAYAGIVAHLFLRELAHRQLAPVVSERECALSSQ
jgi:peptidoglycan biosynthesis protein MviN/MurJ (putative lipid II flippase)